VQFGVKPILRVQEITQIALTYLCRFVLFRGSFLLRDDYWITQGSENLQVGKGGLPRLKIHIYSSVDCRFNLSAGEVERGKPPFLTCKFSLLE
jgi:hypothetical protein